MNYPPHIQQLVDHFARLPGVGPKMAARLVFHLVKQPEARVRDMATALSALRDHIVRCDTCRTYAETNPCEICADPRRQRQIICLVAKPQDIEAMERTHSFEGLYHLLDQLIDASRDVGPVEAGMGTLIERIQRDQVEEVVLALAADMPGETTALYIKNVIKQINSQSRADSPVRLTRLARGLPMGADVEYADDMTLENALRERRPLT